MQRHKVLKTISAVLFAVMAIGAAGSSYGAPSSANSTPINVVWYPNESSNTHEEVRAEVGILI